MSYISVNDLNFGYNKNKLFNGVTFNIEKNTLTCITCPSSKGKTTILNMLCGNIETNSITMSENVKITKITNNMNFYCSNLLEELLYIKNDIPAIKKYLRQFGLLKYKDLSPSDLNYYDSQKLNLIKAILSGSKIILIDNIFCHFDKYSKVEYIGYLRKLQYDNDITTIYTTNNLEDLLFSDRIIIINKEVLYCGKSEDVFFNDEIIKKSKLNIPLERELIEKLKLYNMINNTTYTVEEMVDEICK